MTQGPIAAGAELADLDIAEIMRILPHRYPMLLIDRVIELRAQERAVGIKNVSANEPFFQGHFPGDPIMPGVLILEALAQAAAAMTMASLGAATHGKPVYFMGVDEAKFRRPVRPGDQLRLEIALQRQRLGVWKFKGEARVQGELAAEAILTAKLMKAAT
jgi:3-hydroxyacyl-[acyl-carrier-protein] dehydratase